MDKKARIDFYYNVFYQILTFITPFITAPYIARTIGIEGIGTYSYKYSIASYFMMFIMLGLNNYGNRTIASVRDDRIKLSKNFKSIFVMQLLLGFIVSAIYFGYCFVSSDPLYSYASSLFVLSAIIDINWLFYGLEEFKLVVIRSAFIKILTILCIFIFVKDTNDLIYYFIISGLGGILSNGLLWLFVKRFVVNVSINVNDISKHIKPNLLLFIPVIAVSVYKVMDKIMLGFISNMNQVGFYESAEKWLVIPIALITSLGTIMMPKISNLLANGIKKQEISHIVEQSMVFAIAVASPMTFGVMAISNELVPWFFGDGFQECVLLMKILLPSTLFVAFTNVLRTQYLIPAKEDKSYIVSVILGAIMNFVINLFLIPKYGALGACIGTLIAEITVCIYQSYFLRKKLDILGYLKVTFPFLVFGILMYFIVNAIMPLNSLFVTLILKVLIGIIIYAIPTFIYLLKTKKLNL